MILPIALGIYRSNKYNCKKEKQRSGSNGKDYKAAIKARNRRMIDQSNYVVTCVYKKQGGAYDAMRYAIKQGKALINLSPEV